MANDYIAVPQSKPGIYEVSGLTGTLGSVAALLSHFTYYKIHDNMDALARLGDMEVKHQGKKRSVKTEPAKKKKKGAPLPT